MKRLHALFAFTLLTAPAMAQDTTVDKKIAVDAEAFIDGNLHFLAYHELGHALISEFSLPVLGREEDAVDRLAIWMMTPEDEKEEPEYLKAAINGWFASASSRPLEEIEWWDEHGSDEQRAYQISCLLYGWSPDRYKDIADGVKLPDDRRETCAFEAKANDTAWDTMLQPHKRPEGEPRATGTVTVRYEDTTTFKDEHAYLEDLDLLPHVAEIMESYYKFKPGIAVTASECGEANAYWNGDERKLTICYELVEDFRELAKDLK
jgi:Putative metallopeptidase